MWVGDDGFSNPTVLKYFFFAVSRHIAFKVFQKIIASLAAIARNPKNLV